MTNRDSRSEWARGLALLVTITAEIVGCTGAGIGVGFALHRALGTPDLLTVFFAVLGMGLGLYRVYRIADAEDKKEPHDPA